MKNIIPYVLVLSCLLVLHYLNIKHEDIDTIMSKYFLTNLFKTLVHKESKLPKYK